MVKLELLDFKTSPRPVNSPELIAKYERQLCTYAHILEHRYQKRVDRMMLYWTSEKYKEKCPYGPFRIVPERVDEAGRHFDETVSRIQSGEFTVNPPPETSICGECDLRILCQAEGVITQR